MFALPDNRPKANENAKLTGTFEGVIWKIKPNPRRNRPSSNLFFILLIFAFLHQNANDIISGYVLDSGLLINSEERSIKNSNGKDESIFLRSVEDVLNNNKNKADATIEKFKNQKNLEFLYEKE